MKREPIRILGINPGTRYLGLAVFQDSELFDWRVKTFKGIWTKDKAGIILETIRKQIELYDVNAITIKKLHPARSSKNLAFLVSKIKVLANRKKIKFHQYSIKELEKFFLKGEKHNKRNLSDRVVTEYSMLVHELNKEKSHKNSYYLSMFEAVALASECFHKLDK